MESPSTMSSSSSRPSPPPERSLPPPSSSSVSSSSSSSQQLSSSAQNPLRISNPGSSQTSDTPLPSDVPSGPSPTDTKPPHVQTSDPVTSSDVVSSLLSQPSLPNPPLTGSIDHNGPFTTSTQPDAKSTGVPADSTSQGFFGNTGAVAGTFTVVGIVVGLILLTIFLCCRRHRRNKQPPLQAQDSDVSLTQMHDNPFADDPFASFGPSDSVRTAEHQYRWERRSSFDATDEQAMGYVESTSSTHGFNVQRNDVGDNVIYETRNPRLAGINPGIVVNYRDQNPEDPFSDRPVYQSMPRQASYGKGPTAINHFSAVTPPQAHLPFPNWRRVSETPSSPSVYATSLPAAEDSESQPSTPTSFTFRKPTTVPSQSYNWGASAKKPSSYGIPVIPEAYITPPNSDDGRDTPVQRERQSGEHQYTPPSIPPKSPLRTAMSMRTLLNVRGGKME